MTSRAWRHRHRTSTGVGLIGPLGDCFLDSFTQTFEMPPLERAEAFAVDVNYRQDLGGSIFDETGSPSRSEARVEATEGVGYSEVVLCVPNIYSGRTLTVEAFASGGGGGCADIPAEASFVDDITIGTDASCPAN